MKLTDLIPSADILKLSLGIENLLRKRKRSQNITLVIAVAAAVLQLFLTALVQKKYSFGDILGYIYGFGQFLTYIVRGDWHYAIHNFRPIYELSGLFVCIIALILYLLIKRTEFLFAYSEEPFRYTFWIEPFKHVKDTETEKFKVEAEDRFHYLLHHDLMERLNERIRRLSLLNPAKLDEGARKELESHFYVEGNYTIRELKDDVWVIHVMPRVRIGPPSNAATLAAPVTYQIIYEANLSRLELITPDQYNQVIERIYSSIASEIYKQIKLDLKDKTKLFPTRYLRAVALFYEAEDFARSNTIDAYDQAIELYRASLRYFDTTEIKRVSRLLIHCPLVWQREARFQHMKSRVHLGYAKCLIYRREISALSGRYKNALFEILQELKEVIANLEVLHDRINPAWKLPTPVEGLDPATGRRFSALMGFLTFPKDGWLRNLLGKPDEALSERQGRLLFQAYVVSALTHYYLNAFQRARSYLEEAKAIDPLQSERNPLFLFASGVIEPNVDLAVQFLRQATEAEPNFQIAQYLLARYVEKKFRMQNELAAVRSTSLFEEYEKVLRINPGNVTAIASRGYLLWLLGKSDEAKKAFEGGREIKAIARQTFIGELNYGLARIAAEEGEFNECFDRFSEAISADPGVSAYSTSAGKYTTIPFYDGIGSSMLKRYAAFRGRVEVKIRDLEKPAGEVAHTDASKSDADGMSGTVINKVHSFVLNDYGNACLNYYIRFGDVEQLDEATRAYEQAVEKDEENLIVFFNLYHAYSWKFEKRYKEKAIGCARQAEKLGSTWPPVITLAKSRLEAARTEIKKMLQARERGLGSPEGGKSEAPDTGHEKYAGQVLQEALSGTTAIVRDKKLSPAFEGFRFDMNGKGVAEFLSRTRSIRYDRIDENDVEALIVWANMLFSNYGSEAARKAARGLCEHILERYWPENFDLTLILREIAEAEVARSSNERETEEWRERLTASNQVAKRTVERWSEEDPFSYGALTWVQDFFDKNDVIRILEKAVQVDDANGAKQNMLANVYFEQRDFNRAVQLYKTAVKTAPRIAIYFSNLAGAYRALGYWSEAVDACSRAIELEQGSASYQNLLGIIYHESAEFGRAIEHYKIALKIDAEPVYACNMGRAWGKLGNWDAMAENCHRAIQLRKQNPTDLYELDYYYGFLAEAHANAGRLIELESLLDASDDFKYHPKRRGAICGRVGNVFLDAGDYNGAFGYYEKALTYSQEPIYYRNLGRADLGLGNWDEAIKHLGKAIDIRRLVPVDADGPEQYYLYLGEAYFRAGRLSEFEPRLELSGDFKDDPKKKAAVHNRIGNLYFDASRFKESIGYYEKAIQLAPDEAVYHSNLSGAWESLKEPGKRSDALRSAVKAMAEARSLMSEEKSYESKLGMLTDKSRVALHFGEKMADMALAVTPIAVEVARDLIPYIEGKDGQLLEEVTRALKDMRADISREMGVGIQGSRFRGNEADLPDGTYVIMLNEVPLVSGNISLDRPFFPGPMYKLDAVGVRGDKAVHPLTGDEAVWITRDDWGKATEAGLMLWSPVQYLVKHLEAVVRKNLALFFGVQEAFKLLEAQLPDEYRKMGANSGRLSALVSVCRALLMEGVTIAPFRDIVAVFNRILHEKNELSDAVEAIRCLPAVRGLLPGNSERYRYYRLGENFERKIAGLIYRKGTAAVLAIEPGPCQAMLTLIRQGIEGQRYPAIVVKESSTRPFVRTLVELEFPDLPVLSLKELFPALETNMVGEIEEA